VTDQLSQDDRKPESKSDDINDLWIISGQIFEGEIKYISDKKMAVPTGFFKIIVRQSYYEESSAQTIAVYYPHDSGLAEEKNNSSQQASSNRKPDSTSIRIWLIKQKTNSKRKLEDGTGKNQSMKL